MEKFSLYDLLGLLMPGILFVYFINLINSVFNVFSLSFQSDGWDISTLIFLCFSLIAGAMLYSVNFWLLKQRRYEWLFGMKKHVADIYNELAFPFNQMNQSLNKKANEWYGKDIFFGPNANHHLTQEERDLQDSFYDRMYYELEYLDKIDSAKTIQSFYYFFRQTVTASLLLLIVFIVFALICLIQGNAVPECKTSQVFWLPVLLVATIALSVGHAKWYRKTMVLKMYWAYFTHLNQQPANK